MTQHLEILDAVMLGTVDEAANLLERHIAKSQAVLDLAVAKVLERMLSVGERERSW